MVGPTHHWRRGALWAAAVSVAIGALSLAHAQSMSMTVKSGKVGMIQGDMVAKGLEGRIEVSALSYALPAGAAGEIITVTTPFGRHLPLLLQAYSINDILSDVVIDIQRPFTPGVGPSAIGLTKAQTIVLRNARVAAIRMSETGPTPAAVSRGRMEIDFRFGSIEITHNPGGITSLREPGR
jgi:type VI protein secretion system component Hcp